MFDKKPQKIEGDGNQQAGESIYNTPITINQVYLNATSTTAAEEEISIIQEIFMFALQSSQNEVPSDRSRPTDLLKLQRKIKKNFSLTINQKEVERYYQYSINYIHLIESKFQSFTSNDQASIHTYVFYLYNCNLANKLSNIENLRDLFRKLIPIGKENNPKYLNISQSIVLFFFEDCTIFERTQSEKKQQKFF